MIAPTDSPVWDFNKKQLEDLITPVNLKRVGFEEMKNSEGLVFRLNNHTLLIFKDNYFMVYVYHALFPESTSANLVEVFFSTISEIEKFISHFKKP